MQQTGPALAVEISISADMAGVLQQNGSLILAPISGLALIDTGASISGVDETILKRLGIAPFSETPIHTPSGAFIQSLYACQLQFPGTPIPSLSFNVVTGSQLLGLGVSVLIGRDILQHFQLVYNGVDGFWTLAF